MQRSFHIFQRMIAISSRPRVQVVVSSSSNKPCNGGISKERIQSRNHSTVSSFKPWPVPMVESQGDYRSESFIEDLVGGPLYEKQKVLPKLPIPEIHETLQTLLPTVLPLAETEEEARNLFDACKSFPQQASHLHHRLIHRKEVEMKDSSYLQLWWNTYGYLKVRDPVVVNVSYFFHFSDDASLPLDKPMNVTRGASLLYSAAKFRKLICTGAYPQETIGKKENQVPLW